MGNPRGFLDYKRAKKQEIPPKERIKHYKEFSIPFSTKEVQIQAGRCMDCGIPFCQTGIIAKNQKTTLYQSSDTIACQQHNAPIEGGDVGCPLHNLIPEWNDLVYRGHFEEAYERLSLTNPFPDFTGRVCPAPCEDSCVCAIHTQAVMIKNTELTIIEHAFSKNLVHPFVPESYSDKKIAIIGSGPAGLACAWELNKAGYKVVVFERSDRVGGLLMYGIPDMKLDKTFIKRRIEILQASGITFKPNTPIDSSKKAKQLLKDFDRVVLATGASKPIDLAIKGRFVETDKKAKCASEGIMFALDFLTANTKSLLDSGKQDMIAKGKDVLIIGSGDTSVDCVAVALRQGAKSITRFERSPKRPKERKASNPWPLKKVTFTTDYGLQEALEVYGKDVREYQKLTKEFVIKNGKVAGVVAVDLEWSEQEGKRISKEVQGSAKEYKADLVLLAMGFSGSEESIASDFGVELDSTTNIKTTNNSYATSIPRIYTCGDARIGQSLVVWAIKDGIECARAICNDLADI